ncbi:hypothetical protein JCM3765_006812 [Sporobolomyces pararoseus]
MVLWISPVKLFKQSVLGGVILLLALAAFSLNATIVGLRSYWSAFVTAWQLDNLLGLDGLSFGILLSILWYFTMIFLLVDLMATLLIPSRDLQEGTVIAFGIVSIMQIPLVSLFLMYELNPTNQLWLLVACVETKYAENCSSWLTSHKYMMVIPSALSCAAHIILLGFASWYIRHRAPTSAALLDDRELEYLEAKNKEKEAKKKAKAAKKEAKRKAKEEKEKNRKKRGPTYVWRTPGGSSSGSGGDSSDNAEKNLNLAKDVHTDSSDEEGEPGKHELLDLEKQTSSALSHEKELGRRSRRGSTSSRRSSGRQ